jgi:ABC-type dipeptide/oligopeptide/nickel transport system permease subunit
VTANLAPSLANPELLPQGGADGGFRAAFARLIPKTVTQWIGLVLVVGWIVVAIIAPLISPANPIALHPQDALQGPSGQHPFGTDQIGRDIMSRVFYGARATLPTGFAIVALAMAIGISIGAIAGFSRAWIDEGLMRIADIFLAFPTIILALAVAAALGPDIKSAIVAIAIALWPRYARLIRGEVLSVKEREFVQASRGFGSRPMQTLRRTILPNALPAVLFVAILDVGGATLTGATLSFLGLGTQPPTPEWGAMVSLAVQYPSDWWMGVFPGVALISFVVGVNLYGEVIERERGN